jgi:TolB protein
MVAPAALMASLASGGCSGDVQPTADASSDGAALPDSATADGDSRHDAVADARPDAVAPGPDGAALDGAWLAFASNRLGDFDLFLVRPDGSDLHTVVRGAGNQLYPSWSPDGKTLAYASDAIGGVYNLYTVDAASGAVTRLPNDRGRGIAPTFSPDGTTLAFGGDGPGGGLIYTIPSAGGVATALTTGKARDGLPVWAPDGSVIYFATDRSGAFEIWSVKPDATDLKQVTTGAKVVGGPSVSPDGKVLAYARATPPVGDAGTGASVVLYNLAAKTDAVLTSSRDTEPSFARAGSLVGVTSLRFGAPNPEIVLVDTADAAAPFRLTNDPGVDTEVTFRPTP